MSRWASGAAVVLAVAMAGVPAGAQQTDGGARGVTVLRPQATAPAPSAALSEVAKPVVANPVGAPVAAPVATPAVVAAPVAPPVAPGRPTSPPISPMLKPCPRPFARPAVTLGGGGFDRAMAGALKRRPESAVVDLPQPFAVGTDMPAALTPWLNQVKASGGIVSASEYCHDTRGLFGWLGRMVRAVRGNPYKAAEGYDAVLHVDGLDQKVTQVEFRRRAQ